MQKVKSKLFLLIIVLIPHGYIQQLLQLYYYKYVNTE